jgi:hypothetical protein
MNKQGMALFVFVSSEELTVLFSLIALTCVRKAKTVAMLQNFMFVNRPIFQVLSVVFAFQFARSTKI